MAETIHRKPEISTVPSWLSASSYWMPRNYVVSAWTEHAPFAAWLMDAARPRAVAELGTHNGFSLFAFAESARRLGLDSRFFALDSWEGDDQTGFYGGEVYESVKLIAESDYPGAITLMKGYFSESVSRIEDGSIDLLHIDGRHGYEDVREDFELYLPKVSDRGVVLFHDTFEFQPGFGVNQFWNEISSEYSSFNFEHGHGLGVLAIGANAPRKVLAFLEEARSNPEAVRSSYAELGAVVQRQSVLEIDHFEVIHQLRLRIIDHETREQQQVALIASAETAAAAAAATAEKMRASASWRITRPFRVFGRVVTTALGRK